MSLCSLLASMFQKVDSQLARACSSLGMVDLSGRFIFCAITQYAVMQWVIDGLEEDEASGSGMEEA